MENKMQIEISIKDNLSKQLAQMSENVKKAANAMKQQINAIQEAFNNISIKTDVSKQINRINKEIDNISKEAKNIQINVKAKLDSSGLDKLNVKDKQIKIKPEVEDLDLSEIEGVKDKSVKIKPEVEELDLSKIENIKDKEIKIKPEVEDLDLSALENIEDKEIKITSTVDDLDLSELENIKDKQVKITPVVDKLDLSEIENVKDKEVRVTPVVDKLDLSEIENVKDKEVRVTPIVEELDLSEIENIKDKEVRISPVVDSLDLSEIENVKDKEVRVTPVVENLDLTEIENIKDKQVKVTPVVENLDLSEIENIKDKQVKMSVDVDDSEIKKTFKNIDAEIEDIEDDFDSLDIKSNVIKQIKDIIKEINNIGNKVEDIEIDIKADLDESDLMADLRNFKGEVDVNANVSGLGNFKDQEVNVNANVSGTSNIADMAQLGATSKLSASMKGVSASVKEVAETMKKMFDTGVKNSVEYQTALERVRQAYTQIKDIQLEIGTGPDAQADWAEEFASGETIQNITKTLEAARKQFELFDKSMQIPQAKSCLQLIEELQEALFNIETKEIDTEFLDTLMKKMDALNEMSNIEVDIDANVKEAIDEAIKLGDLAKELSAKKYELRFNVNAEIDNLQDMIDDALSGNPYADIDMSEIGAAQEELEQLRQRQAALNNEIQNLCSKIDIATNNFNNLDYVLRQTGNNTNGAKNAFTVLGNALAGIKQKIAEIVPETSLLGTKFQVLKIYIDSFASKATQQLDKFKKKMAEITPEPIKKAFDKVKSAVSGLPPLLAKAGTGFVNLGKKMAQTRVIASGLNKVMGVFKTTLGKFGLMFGTYELIQFGKQAIATASDIQEAQNVIDVTFQNQSNTINKWAKENASAFGLTELQAKNFAGTFGTIFQAAGVSMDYADDMSMKLAQLAGDLASFRNLSVEDAFEKLRSGIVGSTEPLEYVAA